jgi:hypothetical protein
MDDSDPGCETCRFWYRIVEASGKRESSGRCQRYPPTAFGAWVDGDWNVKEYYPLTVGTSGMGCGEYQKRRVV